MQNSGVRNLMSVSVFRDGGIANGDGLGVRHGVAIDVDPLVRSPDEPPNGDAAAADREGNVTRIGRDGGE
ncbi:hypothetical protein D3C84_1245400 [compost metagenome]